jgi:hypothetical protein
MTKPGQRQKKGPIKQYFCRFIQNSLNEPWVFPNILGDICGPRTWKVAIQIPETTFGLGNNGAGDAEYITVLKIEKRSHQAGDIVAFLDYWQTTDEVALQCCQRLGHA